MRQRAIITVVFCILATTWLLGVAIAAGVASPPASELAGVEYYLEGKRVAVLVTEGFHDQETLGPISHLEEWGAEIRVVGPRTGEVGAYNSDATVFIEQTVGEVLPGDFDALVIPGGRSPGRLREKEGVVDFVSEFQASGRPVAAICHGPEVLIAAGVVEGRRLTAYSAVEEELVEAGAEYVNLPVVRDENLITSRIPADIPDFNDALAAAVCGRSSIREVVPAGEERKVRVMIQNPEPETVTVRWETEERDALTQGEKKILGVLSRAPELLEIELYREYDPDEDPVYRKLVRGEWEEAGFDSLEEAVEAFIVREALVEKYTIAVLLGGEEFDPESAAEMLEELASSPERYADSVENRFRRTELYSEGLSTACRREWDLRHHPESEKRIGVLYGEAVEPRPEYRLEEATSLRFPGENRWIHNARLTGLLPERGYSIRLRDECGESTEIRFSLTEAGLQEPTRKF